MRSFALTLALAVVAASGCAGSSSATAGPGGRSATSAHVVQASNGSGSAPAKPGGAVTTTVAVATMPAAPTALGPVAAASRNALDAYLAALLHGDGSANARWSMDSAAVLGTIRTMVDAVNASRGGHTAVTLTGERFAVATSSADMVTYDGSVTLTTDVTGSRGDAKSTDTISGPVQVMLSSGAWRVRTFTYDGQPLALYPNQARQVVSGVEFDVGAVLSYGSVTTAIVGLGGKSVQPTITLTSTKLTSRGAASGHGTFVSGSGGYGLFVYPRAVGAPTRLDATFANGNSAVAFSLSLTAPPA